MVESGVKTCPHVIYTYDIFVPMKHYTFLISKGEGGGVLGEKNGLFHLILFITFELFNIPKSLITEDYPLYKQEHVQIGTNCHLWQNLEENCILIAF